MKKAEGTRSWLNRLNGKKIAINDIVSFASLAFVSFQNSKRLYYASNKVDDLSLKLSLQVLAMEELSKPLIIFEMIPALEEKLSLSNEEIEKFIDDFYRHPIKQGVLSQYGEKSGRLNYKYKLSKEEVGLLEQIKQKGFYSEIANGKGDPHIPYDISRVDRSLSKKVTQILQEKTASLGTLYNHPLNTLRYYVSHSIQQKIQIRAQWVSFLETTDFNKFEKLDQLISFIEKYEQKPRNGELYVDDEHPDASTITMVLLTKLAAKKVRRQIDVIGVSLFDKTKKGTLMEKVIIFNKLIIKEISKPHLTKNLKNKISYANTTYKRKPNLIVRLRALFKKI